ncbi:MAG: Enoyl-CoA hydratase [isoleucine degradation] (EC / 3-hydroxyacyl-CoA dehydrogenase (EC / 3-hydroxybutyryl-CoA epimerase (EC [uncultured Aureispira sp.]|uniref:Enoyl-CoA hydratase [isoleucine degradation] )) n=1 Tax=uncultured Aureispira sp. TaxID=1331704 RepID=A0A6S6UC61_9BACT|nr:MAG: Enoyl-CoA hydratase [isoleucine degradation] (EC / 3-hydroxyacyl-CoA dehydrogenase (EC / 3-hydroxybutyryl-CoA epimerase (EC [uncultured Aureispira sp.]
MESTTIKNDLLEYAIDGDGFATITINMVKEPTNLFSIDFIQYYLEIAQKAVENPAVKGVIVTSAHRDFMAGADLKFISNPPEDKEGLFKAILNVHQGFRALEQAGKPFVAAINGTALGGGYELALTCHHRIALNKPSLKIGLPEVGLGLLPGGGGTQRLTYLIGVPKATTYILQGKQFRPAQALAEGFIDAIAPDEATLIASAKQWILENSTPVQVWDNKRYTIPQGGLMSKSGADTMIGGIGNLRKKTHGNYPGAQYAMACIHDGMQLPIDRGLEVEARYFIKAFYSKEAQNLIRTGFFAINEAKKGKIKPKGFEFYGINKVGILGAGMMGAGIAYVSARVGMEVVLKDVSVENAEQGKAYSEKLLQKSVSKGRATPEMLQQTLDNIQTTDQAADLAGCDLIIEAVYENPDLKASVTKEAEAHLGETKIFASNTSTIPISLLAKASQRPKNFIGMHFFSPVDKMPLVELIVGEETADYAVAAAVDYVIQIGKIPIVVNDSKGFFTSRVFSTFTREGALLLKEGVPPVMIENIAKRVGMPVGPLAAMDEVSLSLALNIMDADKEERSKTTEDLYRLLHKMAIDLGRAGKKSGKGFYEYPADKKKHIWSGLKEHFPNDVDYLEAETIGKRILHIMALESYRCLEEGVLNSPTDGDVGSLTGFGFPPYTGGVFSYMDYVGLREFVADCDAFASAYGPRFMVPASLRAMAVENKTFY